ncbi:hypothetical protein I3842_10G149900 [Carya illinoinensis]|uniref:Uncharacterized protein n=1 Tax=Carya illinoinensis TaxID=32201 RepID=A0A922DY73_CARIL|nr:hypothetical protein I3842_10G149900 [Carya illinoinensis]
MEGKLESPKAIWCSIVFWLRQFFPSGKNSDVVAGTNKLLLAELNISLRNPTVRQPQIVNWRRPRQVWVKLNVDGSPRSYGGVVFCGMMKGGCWLCSLLNLVLVLIMKWNLKRLFLDCYFVMRWGFCRLR